MDPDLGPDPAARLHSGQFRCAIPIGGFTDGFQCLKSGLEPTVRCGQKSLWRETMFGAGPAGHILNPKTGMAAQANWRGVSVVHRSAAIADGLSTAGVLQGAADLRAMVTRFPDAAVRAIYQDGNTLAI